MADCLISNKDLLTVLVAVAGIALALITAITNRNQRRRDALYRIHDLLTSSDQQEGRRLLYKFADQGNYADAAEMEFASMNRAMATLNAVGLYVRRGIVPGRWVLETCSIRAAAMGSFRDRFTVSHRIGWRP